MSRETVALANAVTQRIDQGEGPPLDMPGCHEAAAHPCKGKSREELIDVIAYLGAQVVGYRNDADRDARLAMQQIGHIVAEYERRSA